MEDPIRNKPVDCPHCKQCFTLYDLVYKHQVEFPTGGCARVNAACHSTDDKQQQATSDVPVASEPLHASPASDQRFSPDAADANDGNDWAWEGCEDAVLEAEYLKGRAARTAELPIEKRIEQYLVSVLSGRQMQTLLDMMPDGYAWMPTSGSYKKILISLRDEHYKQGFEHIDISDLAGCPGEDLVLSIRKDTVRAFIDLVEHCPESVHLEARKLYDKHGQRVINEFCDGDKWNDAQVRQVSNSTLCLLSCR